MVRTPTMTRWTVRGLVIGTVAALSLGVGGWDTKDRARQGEYASHGSPQDKWHAMYYCHGSSLPDCRENEHAWLAETALIRAAPQNPWGLTPETDLQVYDLATGYYREQLRERDGAYWDPDDVMDIPRRVVPGAANFAGVPDFSYSLYDWINKNELCPPIPTGRLPENTPSDCHNYTYWQGGGFNASHFGSQATRTYRRLHATALSAARRARRLRERAEQDPATLDLHRDAIREAEREALAFEGYAQHFLQDRWAMGHMFDRWGSPEFNASGIGVDPTRALMAGAFTGIIHGYESVLHVPDAMSSPEVGTVNTVVNLGARALNWIGQQIGVVDEDEEPAPSRLYVPHWRRPGEEETHPGVGDYRAHDMQRQRYEARVNIGGRVVTYNTEARLPVGEQYEQFMDCSAAGFREVIEAFGEGQDGYGVDGATLRSDIPSGPGANCFDMWATNDSILNGMGQEFAIAGGITTLAQAGFRIGNVINNVTGNAELEDLPPEIQGFVRSRNNTLSLSRIYVHARLRAYRDPDGIDLAQGGMMDLLGVPTGDTYPIASYFEPADIASLPGEDPRGRDAQSIYGFFNRAHADHFCEESDELLPQLRGSLQDNERAMCRLLAQRIYTGVRQESSRVEEYLAMLDADGQRREAQPLCEVAVENWSAPDFDGDPLENMHPGYVPWDFSRNEAQAFAMARGDMSYRSVANWCDQTPVIDYEDEEALAEQTIVAVVEDTRDAVILTGRHFGEQRGTLKIGLRPGSATLIAADDIETWNDGEIRFSLDNAFSDIDFDEDRLSYVFIERAAPEGGEDPGRASVGRFAIQRDVHPPEIARVEITGTRRDIYYRQINPVDEDMEAGTDEPGWFFDREPPEMPDPSDEAFWPIPPGETVTIEVRFNTDMERDADGEEFRLGDDVLTGRWTSRQVWRGEWAVPEDGEIDTPRGGRPLSVMARSDRGAWIDGDPDSPDAQPDTSNRILIDRLPVFVERIEVRGGGSTVYRAEWNGGPDYESEDNLTRRALGDPERILDVEVARAAPAEGEGRLRFETSRDIDMAPQVTVGGARIVMEGEGRRWQGRFDYTEANTRTDENGDIPISIQLFERTQDADPRTATVINDPAQWRRETYWAGLESERGGETVPTGGPDEWHRLGEPPGLSLLVVLDASGSMEENNRMANARAGINQTFANLPEDQLIEFAAVIFYGCGSFSTRSFTRDADSIREFLVSASPSSGTPLAAAHDQAREMFASLADPRAEEWRYATFTDGAETCDGDVAGAVQRLQTLVNRHQAPDSDPPPEPERPDPPPPPVDCQVATWRGYEVRVRDGGRHVDEIRLIEHAYLERALPDGRCIARHQIDTYGVYYGSIRDRSGGRARSRWGVNSRPSETRTNFGTSRLGEDDLLRVRNEADRARSDLVSLEDARNRIEQAVEAAQPGSG